MIKEYLKNIWNVIVAIGVAVGIVSGFITIDGWLQARYTKYIPNIIIEKNIYINDIEVIENKSIYYKK